METMWRSQRVQHPPIQQTGLLGVPNLCARAVMFGTQLSIRTLVAAWMAAPDFPWPTSVVDHAARWLSKPHRTRIGEVVLPDCRAEWIRAEGSPTARAVLYLHGGAFLTCGLNTHRALASSLSRAARAAVLNVGYRMLPRHPISSAIADALDGYRWLCESGYRGNDIVVAGDSAGGYLAFMTALATSAASLPKPAGVVAISPLTDISPDRALCRRGRGVMFPPRAAEAFNRYLARAHDRIFVDGRPGPLVSPVEEDLRDLPPVMIHAGADELLIGDAELMADRLHAADVPCELHLWEGQAHDFAVAAEAMAESRQAVATIGRFIRNVTARPPRIHRTASACALAS